MKHIGPISGVATHGGRWVATAGYDNQVILWDARTRSPVARGVHDHLANQCAFSSDGSLLVSASSDYSARVWDGRTMRLKRVIDVHQDDVEMAEFSPDGRRVATCSRDCTVAVTDLDNGKTRVLRGHGADVISVSWSGDGAKVVSSSDDGTVREWDCATGAQTGLVDAGGVETDTLIITEDGLIVTGDDEGRISVVRDGQVSSSRVHGAGVKRLIYHRHTRQLASLSYDRRAALLRIGRDGALEKIKETSIPSIVWPRSGAFVDRNHMVFGTFGSRYAVWDVEQDRWHTDAIEADHSVNAVAHLNRARYTIGDAGTLHRDGVAVRELGSLCNFLLPAGPVLLSGGQLGIVFDALSGQVVYQHRSPLNCGAAFRKDGVLHAIIGAYTGEGIVLRVGDNGQCEHVSNLHLHGNAVKGLAADADYIFSVCADTSARFTRIADWQAHLDLPASHNRIVNGCASFPGGFASVSRDLALKLWFADGSLESYRSPHENSIKCVAVCPEAQIVATGSYTGAVSLFHLPSRSWVKTVRASTWGISCITAIPGRPGTFAASSYDGSVHEIAGD